MPLPTNGTTWPPVEWNPTLRDMRTWAAWWAGDTTALRTAYQQANNTDGLFHRVRRFFWGRTTTPDTASRPDMHVPIATDLCATSADLLYSQPPTLKADTTTTTDRLTAYTGDGIMDTLLAAAETGAALGGRYQRVTWDHETTPRPFLTTVDADHALPTFRWGQLVAVTFWTTLHSEGTSVLRHVEHHELTAGVGIVQHGLYEGTIDNLGRRIPLAAHPATAPLEPVTDEDGTLREGRTPGLLVTYVPNARPNRRWRNTPLASSLGRSDLDGLEALMDALDETYNSWMRDLRLAKARIFVDATMLDTHGDTRAFNLDREVFTPLDGLSGSMRDSLPIQPQQFNIRVAEHQQTASDLVRRIVRAARYSAATFGDDVQDTDVTATEVRARQQATITTRERKIRLEQPALRALLSKMLTIDADVFHTPGLTPDGLTVTFPTMEGDSPAELAQTAQTLRTAGLLSLETGVRMVHPDWDDQQVRAEAQRINQSNPLTSPDQWRMTSEEAQEDDGDTTA